MEETSLRSRILSGAQYHLLGQSAVMAANLLITPRIVHGLGTDGYALYTFMWTLAGYLIVLNFGTTTTTQRYVAYYQGKKEPLRLSSLLRRLLVFHIGMSLVAVGVLLAGKSWFIEHLLHTHGAVLEAAPRVLFCVALTIPSYFVLQFALNVLYGLQRFGVYNLFFALQSLVVAVCAAGLLFFGRGLTAIAWAFVVAHFALAAAALWSIRALLGAPGAPQTPGEQREIMAFSVKSFANIILWTLIFQGDRVFIGSRLPLSQLGYYVIPASLAQKFNMFSGAVTATTFPIVAELHGLGQEERLRRLYLKASELSLFLLLPLPGIAFILAPQFLTLWLGEEFSRWGTWPMRLLLLSNLVYFTTYLANSVTVGKGHPEVYTYMQIGKVALLIPLWLFLIPRHGIAGAAAGTLATELLCAPAFVGYVQKRFLTVSWIDFLSSACARPLLAGAAMVALVFAVHAQATDWPRLLALSAAGGIFYLTVGYHLLEPEAKSFLSDCLKRRNG